MTDPVESDGWMDDSPNFNIQEEDGGQVKDLTFSLPVSDEGAPRAERRYRDYAEEEQNYSTGVRQFGGIFTIDGMSGDRICLKQTFNDSAPYFMLGVMQSGQLYSVRGNHEQIAEGATVGASVQVNTVHDTTTHQYRVYINGSLSYQDDDAPEGEFYDKFGAYQTKSGSGDITVTWSDIHFWHK